MSDLNHHQLYVQHSYQDSCEHHHEASAAELHKHTSCDTHFIVYEWMSSVCISPPHSCLIAATNAVSTTFAGATLDSMLQWQG